MRKHHRLHFQKLPQRHGSELEDIHGEGYSNLSGLWRTPTDAVVYYIAKRKVGRKFLSNQYKYDLIVELPRNYDEGGWIRVGEFHDLPSLEEAARIAQQIEIDASPDIIHPMNKYGGYDSPIIQPSIVEGIISSMGGSVRTIGYR